MKNIAQKVSDYLKEFIDPSTKGSVINLRQNKILTTIHQAKINQQDIHIIYGDRSFAGQLVKCDRDKLILKNKRQNISIIVPIADIEKVTLVPLTIS